MVDTAADVATARPSSSLSPGVSRPPSRTSGGQPADAVLWATLAGLALAAVLVLLHLGRGTTFFYDEWDWVQTRRRGLIEPLLRPHNGHLLAVPVAIYRVLFALVGLRHYTVFRVTAIGFELLCVGLAMIVVRRELPRLLIVVAAAALLFYGPGWQDLLWPLQIAYTASVAGSLAAIILLRRRDRIGDVSAAVCLTLSVASSGLGLPLLAGAAAYLLLAREWRRLWVIAVPGVLYGLWYLRYGQSEIRLANLPKLPAYMSTTSGATIGGLLGLRIDYGRFFCGVLAALVVVAVVRHRDVPPVLGYALVSVIGMWAAFGLARGQLGEPASSRYLYPGALLVVLVAATLPRRRLQPAVALGLAVVLPFTVWSNAKVFRSGAAGLRSTSQVVRVELGALQVAGSHTEPAFRPDTGRMPQVWAGPYLAAVRALGSPSASVKEIERSSEALREDADGVLVAAYRSAAAGAGASHSCEVAPLSTVTPGSDLLIRAGPAGTTQVWLRRFAGAFRITPDATVAPDAALALALPVDGVATPWELRVAGAGASRCVSSG
jgi:hypothetical protein